VFGDVKSKIFLLREILSLKKFYPKKDTK